MKGMKIKKIKFGIKIARPLGIPIPELTWIVERRNKQGCCLHRHSHELYYPIRRLKWKINIVILKMTMKLAEYEPIQCQGCGEGVAVFKIKDPNDARKRLLCCDGCANFYDKHYFDRQQIVYRKGRQPIFRYLIKRSNENAKK